VIYQGVYGVLRLDAHGNLTSAVAECLFLTRLPNLNSENNSSRLSRDKKGPSVIPGWCPRAVSKRVSAN